MIEIRTLDSTSPSDIFKTFQEAFSDYIVPMNVPEEQMLQRWRSAGIDYGLSYGAYDGNKLVAFILHAPEKKMVFNLGTGVIPESRGQKLIDRIYAIALPDLKLKGFISSELEVITINKTAIRVYERNGFSIKRELRCFKGVIPSLQKNLYQYAKKEVIFSEEMRGLITHPFSFEQSEPSVTRIPGIYELHKLRDSSSLLAYAIYNPSMKSFAQIGAKSWENLPSLISAMNLTGETVRMNNVDSKNKGLIEFWEKLNFENYISQFEMIFI